MKRNILFIVAVVTFTMSSFAQTAETRTDYFGNKTTTFIDSNGRSVGMAETRTDYFGNKTTIFTDSNGRLTGTAETRTDYFGNETTTFSYPYWQTEEKETIDYSEGLEEDE